MNVAGAVFDRLDQNQVGQLDDRRFFAGGGQLVEVDLLDRFRETLDVVGIGSRVPPASAASWMMSSMLPLLAASILLSLSMIAFSEAIMRSDFQLGDAPDVVDGQDVQRVGHRQEQLVFEARDRNDLVVVRHFARQQIGDVQRNADARRD